MKVKEWVHDDETESMKASITGLGGFFNWSQKGMRWKDYLRIWEPELHPYLEAVREDVVRRNIRFGGDYHQSGDAGTPVFEDDTVVSLTFRAWGDLMAAIWSEQEDIDYTYMDFYMGTDIPKKQPKTDDDGTDNPTD